MRFPTMEPSVFHMASHTALRQQAFVQTRMTRDLLARHVQTDRQILRALQLSTPPHQVKRQLPPSFPLYRVFRPQAHNH